jgi:ribosomal protein S8E
MPKVYSSESEDSDDNEKKVKKRKPRKKKLGRAPRELVVLKNADKKKHETYRKGDSALRFCHPYRVALLGGVNSGKSMIVKNILIATQARAPKFHQVIVIHGDVHTKEYSDCDVTQIRSSIPEISELDPDIKKLLIFDDTDFTNINKEDMRRISEIWRFGSTHRNTSILLSHQAFFKVPSIIRTCTNVFIIFAPRDLDSLACIGRRIGLRKETMMSLFKTELSEYRDCLTVNLIPSCPHVFYKNLFTPLEIDES